MSDFVVDRFEQRRKAGEIFFNPMSRDKRAYSVSSYTGYLVQHSSGSQYNTEEPWFYAVLFPRETVNGRSVPLISRASTDAEYSRLLVEASTDVLAKRGRGDSNSWETLAELDKTLAMFQNPLGKLNKWLTAASRAKQLGTASQLLGKTGAGLWLQYRYGIRPIISDVNNIVKALGNIALKRRKTTRSSTRLTRSTLISGSSSSGVLTYPWVNQVNDQITVRGVSLDDVDFSLLDDLGLSGKGLLTLPWELVPYSFVADWMLNIGDFLNAIAPAIGWNHLGSCLTVETVRTNVYTITDCVSNTSGWSVVKKQTGTVGITQIAKERRALVAPGIVVKADFKLDSATRVADAFTLAAQRFVRTFG